MLVKETKAYLLKMAKTYESWAEENETLSTHFRPVFHPCWITYKAAAKGFREDANALKQAATYLTTLIDEDETNEPSC